MDIVLERIMSLIPEKHGAKKEFAESLGLPSNVISDWLAGRNKSYQRHVYRIATAYHVSPEWLKGETDEKENPVVPNEDAEAAEFYELLKSLTPQQREIIFNNIELMRKQNKQREG